MDKAFGFAVGARRVWTGEDMPQAMANTGLTEAGRSIAVAVVSHDFKGYDSAAAVVRNGIVKEGDRGVSTLIGPDLSKRHPRVVIDADMDTFPSSATDMVPGVSGGTMAGALDTAQFLRVEVEQIAGIGAFVSHNGHGRLQWRQAPKACLGQVAVY